MQWRRVNQVEWVLGPTHGYTVAVRRTTPRAKSGWYIWRWVDEFTRELICGGVESSLRRAQMTARATYEAITSHKPAQPSENAPPNTAKMP